MRGKVLNKPLVSLEPPFSAALSVLCGSAHIKLKAPSFLSLSVPSFRSSKKIKNIKNIENCFARLDRNILFLTVATVHVYSCVGLHSLRREIISTGCLTTLKCSFTSNKHCYFIATGK